jgi:hypothetical protein
LRHLRDAAPAVFLAFAPSGKPIAVEIVSVRKRSGETAPLDDAAK